MLSRRFFLAAGAFLALAACEEGPQVASSLAASIAITDVTASTMVTRSNTAVPKDQIVETARRKIDAVLRSANPAGARKVRAEVTVTQFYIANAGAGVLLGSASSSIATQIRLVDVSTGAVIKEPFTVFGVTEPRPTILGAAAIKTPAEELAIITDDLARRSRIAIYGN